MGSDHSLAPVKSHIPTGKKKTTPLQKPLPKRFGASCAGRGETDEKHPILHLFKHCTFPCPLLLRLIPNEAPGAAFPLRIYWRLWAGECQHASHLGWKPQADVEACPVVMRPQCCLNAAGNSLPSEVATCLTYALGATTGCCPASAAPKPVPPKSQCCEPSLSA